jgi:hypothetical protein
MKNVVLSFAKNPVPLGLALLLCAMNVQAADAGFTDLFDGKTLSGWKYVGGPNGTYRVENGSLVCPAAGGGDLYSEKEFSDFILRLDFKVGAGGNNGVGIRCPLGAPGEQMAYSGIEIQVLDDSAPKHKDIKIWQHNGSVYGIIPSKNGQPKLDDWNSYEITAKGRHMKVALNGKTITQGDLNDVTDPEVLRRHFGLFRDKGRIAFLGHSSRVEFRNIRIKELSAETKDNKAPQGFTELFNGRDLKGWKGLMKPPLDNPIKRAALTPQERAQAQKEADETVFAHWKVENGEIVFDGKARSLCTKKDYADFEMLVDWKLPARGDSGIYLRGSPQVQIWDPYTLPAKHASEVGSGGLYNNQKNPSKPIKVADKPIGQWNRFRLIMVGERVHVFLNGELVTRDTVLENYWDRNQPIFPSGQIELQNHGDQLWFKNVYIREIKTKEQPKLGPESR